MSITKATRLVQLYPGFWCGRRDLMGQIRSIASSKAFQAGGLDGLKPSTRERLERALALIGALDRARDHIMVAR